MVHNMNLMVHNVVDWLTVVINHLWVLRVMRNYRLVSFLVMGPHSFMLDNWHWHVVWFTFLAQTHLVLSR